MRLKDRADRYAEAEFRCVEVMRPLDVHETSVAFAFESQDDLRVRDPAVPMSITSSLLGKGNEVDLSLASISYLH